MARYWPNQSGMAAAMQNGGVEVADMGQLRKHIDYGLRPYGVEWLPDIAAIQLERLTLDVWIVTSPRYGVHGFVNEALKEPE